VFLPFNLGGYSSMVERKIVDLVAGGSSPLTHPEVDIDRHGTIIRVEVRMNVAKAVRSCRQIKGLTQTQVARTAGISIGFLCELEKGKKEFLLSTFMDICKALKIEPFLLMFMAETEEEKSKVPVQLNEKLSAALLKALK
jgi:DNA-binding XRE family transcriptional regulator